MGSTLTGSTVASTYTALLKTSDNGSVSSTLKAVSDGDGTDSALQISTAGIKSTGFVQTETISYDGGTTKTAVTIKQLGTWNMDSTAEITIAHGLSDITKVVGVSGSVIRDDEARAYSLFDYLTNLNGSDTGGNTCAWEIDATNIYIRRIAAGDGGFYDSTNFDSTAINRGYVKIEYIVA